MREPTPRMPKEVKNILEDYLNKLNSPRRGSGPGGTTPMTRVTPPARKYKEMTVRGAGASAKKTIKPLSKNIGKKY